MELNDVKLFGRVVRDAEMKTMPNGMKIATFSIATNRSYKNEKGEFVQVGNFFPLSVYNQYAEKILPFLTKGRKVIIDGYLKQDRWEKDGVKKSATAIGVRNIQLIFDAKDSAEKSSLPASEPVAIPQPESQNEESMIYEEEPDFDSDIYSDTEELV